MKNLANAVITAAAFIELSPDDVIDPDSAVKALEDIAWCLRSVTPEEKTAIQEVLNELLKSETSSQTREFYATFMQNVGLEN